MAEIRRLSTAEVDAWKVHTYGQPDHCFDCGGLLGDLKRAAGLRTIGRTPETGRDIVAELCASCTDKGTTEPRYLEKLDAPSPGPWVYSGGSVYLDSPRGDDGWPILGVATRCSVPDTFPVHLRIPAYQKDRNIEHAAAALRLRDLLIRMIDAERDRRGQDDPEPPSTRDAVAFLRGTLKIDI